jgi:hypothetical protein
LHTHIQVWIKGFDELCEKLHSRNRLERRGSESEIIRFVDNISSCSLINVHHSTEVHKLKEAFDHKCAIARKRDRSIPIIVDDQSLRNLRQRKPSNVAEEEEVFAYCPHCSATTWSNNEFIKTYFVNYIKVPGLTQFPEGEERRLKSMALEYQEKGNDELEIMECVINAAYNHHRHTKSCFERHNSEYKCQGKDEIQECRYRYPQSAQKKTIIKNASDNPVSWYKWRRTTRPFRNSRSFCSNS